MVGQTWLMKEFKKKTLQLPCPTPKFGYTWVVSTVLSTVLPTAQELGWGHRTSASDGKGALPRPD